MRTLSIFTVLVVAVLLGIALALYFITKELAANQAKLSLTAAELRYTKEQLDRTTEARDKALVQNETHVEDIQEKQAHINHIQGLKSNLTRDIESLLSANNELEAKYTELGQRSEKAKEEISTLASENSDLRFEVRTAMESIQKLQDVCEEQSLVLEDFVVANDDVRSTNDLLRIAKERAEISSQCYLDGGTDRCRG